MTRKWRTLSKAISVFISHTCLISDYGHFIHVPFHLICLLFAKNYAHRPVNHFYYARTCTHCIEIFFFHSQKNHFANVSQLFSGRRCKFSEYQHSSMQFRLAAVWESLRECPRTCRRESEKKNNFVREIILKYGVNVAATGMRQQRKFVFRRRGPVGIGLGGFGSMV